LFIVLFNIKKIDFYQNQLNFSSLKNLLIDENIISQTKLDSLAQKLNFSSLLYNPQTNELSIKKLLFASIIVFAFLLSLKLFGFRINDLANLISKIPFTLILIIFYATILIAFLAYSLLKISVNIEEQRSKHIIIARKTQEIISLYLNKLKDYDFQKIYIENNFLVEAIARRLNVSKEYFTRNIMPYVKKENPEYRFISYIDSHGIKNAFWRLKTN